jgi:RHS repeat-associated protein
MMTLGGGQPKGAVYFDDVSISSPSVSSGANELGNPAFTNLTVAWQTWGGGPLLTQTTAHSGTTSLLLPASSWLGQTVTGLTPNGSYTLSAYLSGGQGTLTAGSGSTTVTASSGWTQVEVTGVASSSGTLAITAASSGGGTVYWDDFSINGTSASGGQQFGYDGFGNLLSQTPIFGSAPMMSLSVNPNTNQVTSGGAVYDGAGNMTQNGSATNLTYDEMNRMITHQSAQNIQEYTYSPGENKRMMVYSNGSPALLNLFVYGPNGRVLASIEYQKSGSNWVAVGGGQTNHLYLGSKALNYAENNIGSTTTATTFWPYGQTNTGAGGVFGTYLADPSGFLYADQRYYNQTWGRFVTADPSSANIDPTSSGSWNRYAYVNGDPINRSDGTGLCSVAGLGLTAGNPMCPDNFFGASYSVGPSGLNNQSTVVNGFGGEGDASSAIYSNSMANSFYSNYLLWFYDPDRQAAQQQQQVTAIQNAIFAALSSLGLSDAQIAAFTSELSVGQTVGGHLNLTINQVIMAQLLTYDVFWALTQDGQGGTRQGGFWSLFNSLHTEIDPNDDQLVDFHVDTFNAFGFAPFGLLGHFFYDVTWGHVVGSDPGSSCIDPSCPGAQP